MKENKGIVRRGASCIGVSPGVRMIRSRWNEGGQGGRMQIDRGLGEGWASRAECDGDLSLLV